MTEQTETIDTVDDKELFQSAIEEVPTREPEPAPATVAAQDSAEKPRDEKGRFVAKEQQEQPEAVTPAPEEKPEGIPSWRLKEEADARREALQRAEQAERSAWEFQRKLEQLQQQVQQLHQPKQEPVDWFQDPSAALKQHLSPIEQQFQALQSNLVLRASKAEAIAAYGRETVVQMEEAVGQAMRSGHPDMAMLSVQMRQSDDPVGIAMKWYQQDKLLKDTGGDLEKFKAKVLEDALKDPSWQAKAIELARGQAGTARPNIQLPPSINRATGSGGSVPDNNDMSDAALFAHAISGRR